MGNFYTRKEIYDYLNCLYHQFDIIANELNLNNWLQTTRYNIQDHLSILLQKTKSKRIITELIKRYTQVCYWQLVYNKKYEVERLQEKGGEIIV